jgi:nitroreductase
VGADLPLISALRTTGAVRGFTSQPVEPNDLRLVLDDARFAPSGGNRQPWRVAVVNDRQIRIKLGEAMRPVWDEYVSISSTGRTPFSVVAPSPSSLTTPTASNAPNNLLDQIEDVPVVLAVAADLSRIAMMDKDLDRPAMTGGASVYPFCWSILLSARARGLGGVLTTFASRAENITGPLLGLPLDHALAAVIFLGYPVFQPTRLRRSSVESFATIDRFDGRPF